MAEETEPIIEEADSEHLDDLPDGAGCPEIWEHISETKERGVRCNRSGRKSESLDGTGE